MEFTAGRTILYKRDDFCHQCSKENIELLLCGRCRYAYYCSKECQITNWKNLHKVQCNIHSEFNPYEAADKILNMEKVKDAFKIYSRFSPRIQINGKGEQVLTYFQLICVNLFGKGDEKRSGVYMIMKLGPMDFVRNVIHVHNHPKITQDNVQDAFIVRFSFYVRKDTETKNTGSYYFIDMVEKLAYAPEVTGKEAITSTRDIQDHAQIFGNVGIDSEFFDTITANNNKTEVICTDAEGYMFKHQCHPSLHYLFDK